MSETIIPIGGKKAVLVGINKYDDSIITNLNYSVSDVKSCYDLLVDQERGGYNTNEIKLLIDDNEVLEIPIRSNIMSAIKSLANSANTDDSILLYFSGHGIEKDGNNYLACKDSRYNVLENTAISIKWIKEILERSQARVKMLILDACHAGAIIGKDNSGVMSKSFHDSLFPAPEGFAILSSCKINEVSHEWEQFAHSVFSYYLIEGLEGLADENGDNVITVSEANKYTSENVKRWSFSNSVEQNPTLECKISGELPIVSVPFSEAAIDIPKPDKSKISEIELKQQSLSVVTSENVSRDQDKINAANEAEKEISKISAILLRYYPFEKIEYVNDFEYIFPDGRINVILENYSSSGNKYHFHIELFFEYRKENWKIIDEIMHILDDYNHPYWDGIVYNLGTTINYRKLINYCNEKGFKINEIRVKPPQCIGITTKGWGCAESYTKFEINEEGGQKIIITPTQSSKRFNEGFYDSINPENIIKFLEFNEKS